MNAPSGGEILLPLILARREAARAAHDAARAARAERAERARLAHNANPADRRLVSEWRQADAAARTEDIVDRVERLRTLLEASASFEAINFELLKESVVALKFDAHGLDTPEMPPQESLPSPPSGLVARLFPSSRARHQAAVEAAKEKHQSALREHAERERDRERRLDDLKATHLRAVAEVEERAGDQHRRIGTFQESFNRGDPDALLAFFAAVLASSDYPEGFPRKATLALDPDHKLLVVDYEMPGLEVVPAAESFKYDASSDRIEDVPRPPARRKDLYALVVAEIALRSVRELFESDRGRVVREVAFNGYVHGIDRATGEAVRPYLVSLRATREEFALLDVTRTDPMVSIHNLEASFSTNAAELTPVRQVTGVHAVGVRHMITTPD